MRHEFRLEVKQEQRQVLSLLLKIIQAPRLELEHMIVQELQQNPMLEIGLEEETEDVEIGVELLREEEEDEKEKELMEFITSEIPKFYAPSWQEREEFQEPQEVYLPDLKEHLLTQLRITFTDEEEIRIGEFIIESLTPEGYFTMEPQEVAEALKVDREKVEKVLSEIKKFDPPGIAARDAREALLRQLEEKGIDDLARRIVEEFYSQDVETIKEKLGVSEEEIERAMEEIRKLNPAPASGKWGEVTYVIPEVLVEKEKGEWKVILDESNIPFLHISTRYIEMLESDELPEETKKWLRKRLRNAVRFLRLLEERRKMILKVVQFIVEHQRDFLEGKTEHLRPLKLRDIAERLGVDISTVHRILKGRYVQTPRGIFELRYFLAGGVRKGWEYVSKSQLEERIREIVDNEDKQNPLSDAEIAEILKKEGYRIARRTVAKYREKLGIPPKNKRRKC